jgi:hypothetical protein
VLSGLSTVLSMPMSVLTIYLDLKRFRTLGAKTVPAKRRRRVWDFWSIGKRSLSLCRPAPLITQLDLGVKMTLLEYLGLYCVHHASPGSMGELKPAAYNNHRYYSSARMHLLMRQAEGFGWTAHTSLESFSLCPSIIDPYCSPPFLLPAVIANIVYRYHLCPLKMTGFQ